MFVSGADVIAVVAFAGEEQHQVAAASKLACASGNTFSDTADHLGFRLAGCPGGFLPFPHLRDADDRNWHGVRVLAFDGDKRRIAQRDRSALAWFDLGKWAGEKVGEGKAARGERGKRGRGGSEVKSDLALQRFC